MQLLSEMHSDSERRRILQEVIALSSEGNVKNAINYSMIHKMISLMHVDMSSFTLTCWGSIPGLNLPTLNDENPINRIVFSVLLSSLVKLNRLSEAVSICNIYLKSNMKYGVKSWMIIIKRCIESLSYPIPSEFNVIASRGEYLAEWCYYNELTHHDTDTIIESILIKYLFRKVVGNDVIESSIKFLSEVTTE